VSCARDPTEGLRRLSRALKRVRYPERLSLSAASAGDPAVFLPMLRFLLSGYSKHVSAAFSSPAYRFATHALDQQFCDNALRAVRDVLGVRGRLTTLQFMSPGFGDHKMVYVAEVATRCADLHEGADRASARAALRVLPHVAPVVDTPTLLHRRYSAGVMRPVSAAPPDRPPASKVDRLGLAPTAGKLSPGKVCVCASARVSGWLCPGCHGAKVRVGCATPVSKARTVAPECVTLWWLLFVCLAGCARLLVMLGAVADGPSLTQFASGFRTQWLWGVAPGPPPTPSQSRFQRQRQDSGGLAMVEVLENVLLLV
jgi:hypothetical protein